MKHLSQCPTAYNLLINHLCGLVGLWAPHNTPHLLMAVSTSLAYAYSACFITQSHSCPYRLYRVWFISILQVMFQLLAVPSHFNCTRLCEAINLMYVAIQDENLNSYISCTGHAVLSSRAAGCHVTDCTYLTIY